MLNCYSFILKKINQIIDGCLNKPILIDVTYNETISPKHIVIFSHGFKGFKDWGSFNKIAEYFALNNFVFVKFNFSYNGTTPQEPLDFVDLSAFGNNNFCKELDDLRLVINWIFNNRSLENEIDTDNISLFGHSRGGGISIINAFDNRINKVVSWASPSDLLRKLPSGHKLNIWKKTNVAYVYNGRTKQNMPMYFQFYENCIQNQHRLNIKRSLQQMNKPHLIVHGSEDETVSLDEALQMKSWNKKTKLHIIDGANHVFDSFHPYNLDVFPSDLKEALDVTISFLKG